MYSNTFILLFTIINVFQEFLHLIYKFPIHAPQCTLQKWIISFVLLLEEYWQVQPEDRLTKAIDSHLEITHEVL